MTDVAVRVAFAADADPTLGFPVAATAGSAGVDLRANLKPDSRQVGLTVRPGGFLRVPCGIRLDIPGGYEAQVRPRSGMAGRNGVTVLNSPGTIDSDYRGEIGVILINHGPEPFRVSHGDRIAQLVVLPVATPKWVPVTRLAETRRGAEGFGSTGRR